jgi:hypothetical protein
MKVVAYIFLFIGIAIVAGSIFLVIYGKIAASIILLLSAIADFLVARLMFKQLKKENNSQP